MDFFNDGFAKEVEIVRAALGYEEAQTQVHSVTEALIRPECILRGNSTDPDAIPFDLE